MASFPLPFNAAQLRPSRRGGRKRKLDDGLVLESKKPRRGSNASLSSMVDVSDPFIRVDQVRGHDILYSDDQPDAPLPDDPPHAVPERGIEPTVPQNFAQFAHSTNLFTSDANEFLPVSTDLRRAADSFERAADPTVSLNPSQSEHAPQIIPADNNGNSCVPAEDSKRAKDSPERRQFSHEPQYSPHDVDLLNSPILVSSVRSLSFFLRIFFPD